jgi:hypothetical protein
VLEASNIIFEKGVGEVIYYTILKAHVIKLYTLTQQRYEPYILWVQA